jgi:transcriptional regulator with XRE-family HTH domain
VLEEMMDIGDRVRKIRTQQGRTIQEIADVCQCSKALLSKIENNKVVPAVATLSKIAKALGVKVSVLLEEGENGGVAYTPNMLHLSEAFVATSKGYGIFAFAPHVINKKMQPMLFRAVKGEVKTHTVHHDGEEFIYVLEGELKVHIGSVEYTLTPGESVYFEAVTEHGVMPVTPEALYLDIFVE